MSVGMYSADYSNFNGCWCVFLGVKLIKKCGSEGDAKSEAQRLNHLHF